MQYSHVKRISQPILNIRIVPDESAQHLNIDVPQSGGIQHSVNVVRRVLEHNMRILMTCVESNPNSRSVVYGGVSARLNNAFLRPRWSRLETSVGWAFLDYRGLPAVVVAKIFARVLISPMMLGSGGACWG